MSWSSWRKQDTISIIIIIIAWNNDKGISYLSLLAHQMLYKRFDNTEYNTTVITDLFIFTITTSNGSILIRMAKSTTAMTQLLQWKIREKLDSLQDCWCNLFWYLSLMLLVEVLWYLLLSGYTGISCNSSSSTQGKIYSVYHK